MQVLLALTPKSTPFVTPWLSYAKVAFNCIVVVNGHEHSYTMPIAKYGKMKEWSQ